MNDKVDSLMKSENYKIMANALFRIIYFENGVAFKDMGDGWTIIKNPSFDFESLDVSVDSSSVYGRLLKLLERFSFSTRQRLSRVCNSFITPDLAYNQIGDLDIPKDEFLTIYGLLKVNS